MTELEEKLLSAFAALSQQYEEEQRRQSERIARLSRQIDGLSRQIQRLAGRPPPRSR